MSTVEKKDDYFNSNDVVREPAPTKIQELHKASGHFRRKENSKLDGFGISAVQTKPLGGQGRFGFSDTRTKQGTTAKQMSDDLGEFDFDDLDTSFSKSRFPSLKKMVWNLQLYLFIRFYQVLSEVQTFLSCCLDHLFYFKNSLLSTCRNVNYVKFYFFSLCRCWHFYSLQLEFILWESYYTTVN